MGKSRVSEWADYLKDEIDDKIGEIKEEHRASYDLCEANVVADEIRKAELQDVWEKMLRLQERYDAISKERNTLRNKLCSAKNVIARELGLPYWASDADISIHAQIVNKHQEEVNAMFESLPEGEQIVELRNIRDGIERRLELASMDKRLVPAIRQICEAAGVEIEGLED